MQKNYAGLAQDITLREYQILFLAKNLLSKETAEFIWEHYQSYLDIDFPSAKTQGRWKIKAKGWVGYLGISSAKNIVIEPKVDILQFFQMVEL